MHLPFAMLRRDICFDGPVDKANCINAFEHVLICTPDFIRGGYAIKFRNTHYIKPLGQSLMCKNDCKNADSFARLKSNPSVCLKWNKELWV